MSHKLISARSATRLLCVLAAAGALAGGLVGALAAGRMWAGDHGIAGDVPTPRAASPRPSTTSAAVPASVRPDAARRHAHAKRTKAAAAKRRTVRVATATPANAAASGEVNATATPTSAPDAGAGSGTTISNRPVSTAPQGSVPTRTQSQTPAPQPARPAPAAPKPRPARPAPAAPKPATAADQPTGTFDDSG